MHPGDKQQLVVRAQYTDGHWRDVTWLTKFAVNDAGVLEVSPDGLVRALREGETAVRAQFRGQVAISIFTVPFNRSLDPARLAAHNNFIDERVMAKLAALHIPPSDLCSDQAFLRRASLDTIGTLPTFRRDSRLRGRQEPRQASLADRSIARSPGVRRLLGIAMGRVAAEPQAVRDHDVRGSKGVRAMHEWLREQVRANRPWDEMVRDLLTASGSVADRPEIGFYLVNVGEEREAEKSPIVASVAEAFLGTRIGCAKCHNHPLEKYTQDDYYHFAAFFCSLKMDRGTEIRKGSPSLSMQKLPPGRKLGTTQPRTGQFLAPAAVRRQRAARLPPAKIRESSSPPGSPIRKTSYSAARW